MASASWNRRNEAARAAGYKNYYDYRAHGFGTRAADQPAYRGEDLARLRGHRGRADLERQVDDGALVTFAGAERDPKTGRYLFVDLAVIDPNGRERIYRLRGKALDGQQLAGLVSQLTASGAILTPTKSLDLADYANDAGGETDYDEIVAGLE